MEDVLGSYCAARTASTSFESVAVTLRCAGFNWACNVCSKAFAFGSSPSFGYRLLEMCP